MGIRVLLFSGSRKKAIFFSALANVFHVKCNKIDRATTPIEQQWREGRVKCARDSNKLNTPGLRLCEKPVKAHCMFDRVTKFPHHNSSTFVYVCCASATTKMHLIEIYANMYKMEILMTNLKLETVIWRALKWVYTHREKNHNGKRIKQQWKSGFCECVFFARTCDCMNKEEKRILKFTFMQTLSMASSL